MGEACCAAGAGNEQTQVPNMNTISDRIIDRHMQFDESSSELGTKRENEKYLKLAITPGKKTKSNEIKKSKINVVKTFNAREANAIMSQGKAQAIPIDPLQEGKIKEEQKEEEKVHGKSAVIPLKTYKLLNRYTTNFRVSPENFRGERKGNIADKYELVSYLDNGAFGEINLILDKDTDEIKAEKIIKKINCQMTENFSDEIKILQKLDHPNIVRFYEFYSDDYNYYLITEYCLGGNLLSLLAINRTMNENIAKHIMKQIFSAVTYCHKKHIVHRDLKPENILFSGKSIMSTLKVIDFGRSKILKFNEKLKELAGSLYYIAPEVLLGKEYNEQCDLWSCGIILYMILIGKPPFQGNTKEELLREINKFSIQSNNDIWNKITDQCKDLILKLLTIDYNKRITADKALLHPWIELENETQLADYSLSLYNLKKFQTQLTFQKAILCYIATQYQNNNAEEKLREKFDCLDLDKNGVISIDELEYAFNKIYGNSKKAKQEAEKVIKNVDLNHNGCIDYNGNPFLF